MPQTSLKIAINHLSGLLQVFACFWMAATIAQAENRVIGTVELSVDGNEQTWYVLQPTGDLMPTALWVPMGPGKGAIAIGAYSERNIELIEDETTGASVPADAIPVLILSVGFPLGIEKLRYDLPVGAGEGPATVMMQPNWKDYTVLFDMSDGPGEIRLDNIRANEKGNSQFAGTFRGRLHGSDGSVKHVTNGRFRVSEAKYFEGKRPR